MDDGCCATPAVKGGSFTLGKSTTATVADFALDKYEVTVGRFRKFVEAYSGPPSEGSGAHPLIADSGWQPSWNASIAADGVALASDVQCDPDTQTVTGANDSLPMNCVSWFEAFAFCAWDGGRLPTEAEWEYAAKGGSEGRWFPWGNDPIPSGFQDETSAFANYNCLGDGSAPGACALTDILAVGSKPAGASKYGQLDMAGSVREWTLDWHNPLPASCINCASLSPSTERVARGGSWTDETMYVASDNRLLNLPRQHYKFMGVRCARNN
jgi:formylglycine-generating enzyme required for sulfatase activity